MYCASVFKLRLIHVVQRSDLDCDVLVTCVLPMHYLLPNAFVAT